MKSYKSIFATSVMLVMGTSAVAEDWDKDKWLSKLEAAVAAEGNMMIQYDAQPNYANWGGITALFQRTYDVDVPPDMKGSSATMAALMKERESTEADVAYYNALVGIEATRRGLHSEYRPMNWEKVPDSCKGADGQWFCLHQGVIAFIVNTEALANADVDVPKCWSDLTDPKYKNLVAYDDATVHGTALEVVIAATLANGGSVDNLQPGLDYLKELDENILRYSRDSSYNPALRGEVGIWMHADGSGYKMKYEDGGPIEVVIPCEGTVAVPLSISKTAWAKRPQLAEAYLDWLLSPEAQGLWADSYWQPIIPEYMTEKARERMTPLHGDYGTVFDIPLTDKAKIVEPLKAAWNEQVKRN